MKKIQVRVKMLMTKVIEVDDNINIKELAYDIKQELKSHVYKDSKEGQNYEWESDVKILDS